MGHWSKFCAITHLPITGGQRCVAIWTKPPEYEDEYRGNVAVTPFYRGTYDSYGRLEFDEQPYRELANEDSVDGMFILESVFDELDKFSVGGHGDGLSDGSYFANGDITSRALVTLGFELDEKEAEIERYKKVFTHPKYPDLTVYSDGTWIRLQKNGETKFQDSVYDFDKFSKFFPDLDYSLLKSTPWEQILVDSAYKNISKRIDLFRSLDPTLGSYDIERFCENNCIGTEMYKYCEDPEFRKRVAKIFRVSCFMRANNQKFGYVFAGGPQDGNFDAARKLHELLGMGLEARAAEEKEWEDEDE